MHIKINIINAIKWKYASLATFKIALGGIRGLNPTSTSYGFRLRDEEIPTELNKKTKD